MNSTSDTPTSNPENLLSFQTLPLIPELQLAISGIGYTQMTPIQAASIPVLLDGKDLIGQSKTGSGKTAAFVLPILQRTNLEHAIIQALVICPTRELVTQVVNDFRKLGRSLPGLKVLSLTGGQPGRTQAESLEHGVHVVVGTPGRLLDHSSRGRIDFSDISTVVLDEADKMLEMGFADEIQALMQTLPTSRQTVLFSATFPQTIIELSKLYQIDPVKVNITEDTTTADGEKISSSISQFLYDYKAEDKTNTLMRILQQHPSQSTVIFCNQKATIAQIGELLTEGKISFAALHGDLEQKERDRVLAMFRNGSHRILLATDVASRGLDIENLELVVNYDIPLQPEVYIHRIGRTGRAGKSGTAVTLMMSHEELKIFAIEQLTGKKMERKPLGFKNQHGLGKSFQAAPMQTIMISGGRKDKLRPGDILGALTALASNEKITSDDVGKIEIHDRFSYVAVKNNLAQIAFTKLQSGKIKGSKYQVRFVK